ncbi:MAG: hydantoinase/oxoprolinase family protein [Xanthomonadales bacterium]|jgi:N-methylhydantoinase A|nr:hydantoinase/oxoprolinase family protein [Xanthomonadales bacterium]
MTNGEQATPSRVLVGVDTGGTFTDLVAWRDGSLSHEKVLSTPDDPSRAIVEGMRRLGLDEVPVQVIHGTTVGTNAVLEGKGVRVAYVTSAGFADVLTLARQNRREVYALAQPLEPPPVPPELCFEVSTRSSAEGRLLARATDGELDQLVEAIRASGATAVAVNLLFSFLCPEEERRVAERLDAEWFVSLSSDVLPEIREFERGMATWLNASVGPIIGRYLERLEAGLPKARISVMQSSGTTVSAGQAAAGAVRLLLSGPAGGIAAGRLIGEVTGRPRLLTLDMGGTSTDVALLDGGIPLTQSSSIAGWPLSIPTVDIHTIGAGGGSVARVDAGGMLLVGPESAGADPGPACYGQGGEAVTVTDANLVLGRIPPDTRLGGTLPLDLPAARAAMDRLASELGCDRTEAAQGVLRLANEHMARALRVISVERGQDPREDTLLCFGGAGGLHACELADLLGMRSILLPALAGVLSAHGMLASEPGRDLSHAVLAPWADQDRDEIDRHFGDLEQKAREALADEGIDPDKLRFHRQLELRYLGQNATLVLDDRLEGVDGAFHEAFEASSGHRLDRPVELVNLRLSARAPAPRQELEPVTATATDRHSAPAPSWVPDLNREVPVIDRAALAPGDEGLGPCIIVARAATAWIAPGWAYALDRWGNLVLTRGRG